MTHGRAQAFRDALEQADALAFVHAGPASTPAIRHLLSIAESEHPGEKHCSAPASPLASTDSPLPAHSSERCYAVGFDGRWLVHSSAPSNGHPATTLAESLRERHGLGLVCTPATIPHDAALFLEQAGFSLVSTTALTRARSRKRESELAAIERAQRAAVAGVERAASLLARATVVDGALEVGGEALTVETLRVAIDTALVSAGCVPAIHSSVSTPARNASARSADRSASRTQLRAGEPIVIEVVPRERGGYHGWLTRTIVVDGEGGPERRAQVALEAACRSAHAMLTADTHTVGAIEADLEAEIRAFGFDEAIDPRVSGIGLESFEAPLRPTDELEPGCVVRLEATLDTDRGVVGLADLLVLEPDGPRWLVRPTRAQVPAAFLE